MGRGRSKAGGGGRGGTRTTPIATPVDPVIDKGFDVTKQKPTRAAQTDNMNEAQLLQEIARAERRQSSAEREAEAAWNSGSVRRFNDVVEQFPGGVGGSAVTPAYRRMVERAGNQMIKGAQANERARENASAAERYRSALNDVKGTGLLVHEARTARAAVGGRLDGKWTRSKNAATDSTFGALAGQVNGDFAISKVWGSYHVYRNGRAIGRFDKADSAKRLVEKYAGK